MQGIGLSFECLLIYVCLRPALALRRTGNKLPLSAARILIAGHNFCRRQEPVRLGKVVWDADLARSAEKYAEDLALRGDCHIRHSDDNYRENIQGWFGELAGENLMWGENVVWKGTRQDVLEVAQQSPMIWCAERRWYDIKSTKCRSGKQCGHYTQMIWHDSRIIGCGMSFCRFRPTAAILACHYQKGGNYVGQRPYKLPKKPSPKRPKKKRIAGKAAAKTAVTLFPQRAPVVAPSPVPPFPARPPTKISPSGRPVGAAKSPLIASWSRDGLPVQRPLPSKPRSLSSRQIHARHRTPHAHKGSLQGSHKARSLPTAQSQTEVSRRRRLRAWRRRQMYASGQSERPTYRHWFGMMPRQRSMRQFFF